MAENALAAALEAIGAAHEARGVVWTSLELATAHLTRYDPPRPGIARVALRDALTACEDTRAAIATALAEAEKLNGKAADHG